MEITASHSQQCCSCGHPDIQYIIITPMIIYYGIVSSNAFLILRLSIESLHCLMFSKMFMYISYIHTMYSVFPRGITVDAQFAITALAIWILLTVWLLPNNTHLRWNRCDTTPESFPSCKCGKFVSQLTFVFVFSCFYHSPSPLLSYRSAGIISFLHKYSICYTITWGQTPGRTTLHQVVVPQ